MVDRKGEPHESWARRVAERFVDSALAISERQPRVEQQSLMREIARRALWHMADAPAEARNLAKDLEIGGLLQPHPRDTPPGRD